jgi:GAF domain-containing protein
VTSRVAASTSSGLHAVLAAVAKTAARLCEARDAQIALVEGDHLRHVVHYGVIHTGRTPGELYPLGPGTPIGHALSERRIVHIRDMARAVRTRYPEMAAIRGRSGSRTVLAAPMLRDGVPVGGIVIRRRVVRPFTARQIALLKTFADQAALAIENARLSEQLEAQNQTLTEALEQQTATGEILRVISGSPSDLQPILDTVAESAARLCAAYDALIYQRDGDILRRVAHHGPIPVLPLPSVLPVSSGLVSGRAVLDQRPIHVADLQAEPGEFPEGVARAKQLGFRTVLSVPLLREGVALGVIAIRRTEVRPFTEHQVALLRTFADQAVIAIENVRLFTELQERNRELSQALEQQTTTGEILRVISRSPTDIQPVLDAVAESAMRLCAAYDAIILRLEGNELRRVAHYGPIPAPPNVVVPLTRETVGGRTVLDRRPIHVADLPAEVEEFPVGSPVARQLGSRTVLSVPLLRDGAAIGVIYLRRTEVKPFTDKQIALLQTFADQAVIAIENVRLFTELESRNRALSEALEQQTATAEILRTISSSPTDTQPIFDVIVRNAVRLCDALYGLVFRHEAGLFHMVAHHNLTAEQLAEYQRVFPRPDTASPVARSVMAGQVLNIPDVEAWAEAPPESLALWRSRGVRSLLSVPLRRQTEVVGQIGLSHRAVGAFTDGHAELLKTFADQAVIAIENVRLFTELQASNRELTEALDRQTATAEILRAISQAQTDIQPVFEAIADSAMRLFRAWSVLVFRYESELIRLTAARGGLPGSSESFMTQFQEPRRATEDTPPGRAALTRTVQHVTDVDADPAWGPRLREDARTRGFRSVVAVPLLRGGDVVGVFAVTRDQVGGFASAEIALLQTFADQAVIAVENARLLTELQARNRDLTEALEQQMATSEILRVISSSPTDIQPVLDAVVQNASRLCDAKDAQLFRIDGEVLRLAASFRGDVPVSAEVRAHGVPLQRGTVTGRSVLDRRAIHVHDIAAELDTEYPGARVFQQATGMRTVLAVPLLRENDALGAILIRRFDVRPFSEKQIALLQTFADQAVIAIENVRLFAELQTRNRELSEALDQQTATGEILRVISSSPTDVQPVLDAVAESAARLCGASDALVVRVEAGMMLRVAHFGGITSVSEMRPVAPDTPTGRAIIERRAIHIDDIRQALARGDYLGSRTLHEATGFRTVLAVPLVREAEVMGAITIRRLEVRPFTDKQVALVQTFTDQAVIAIENVRLFTELQARTTQLTRSVDQLTALGEVSRALSSTLDLETVLQTIVARANQLAGTDACSVSEYDEASEEFRLRATNNLDAEFVALARRTPIRKGEGIQGRMALTRQPAQIPDIASADAYGSPLRDVLVRSGARALLAIPLLREDHLVGSLTVTRKTVGEFSPEVIELLQTFASQSALAIQNARLFREIEEQSRQLEMASRHKSQFLANMSHELRTPLNAILGYTELIGDNIYGEVPEKMREVLERVEKSGRHLLGLINDILDLSKIEAGQLTLALNDYAMQDVVRSVAAATEALARAKGLGLEVVVPDDLPIGRADERRLMQVLLNLVGNAIKFTEVGNVSIRAELADGTFRVAVADTGPGIAETDQEKIFEEFQQADSAVARTKGGTGLGLAIARRIIEMHSGRLWLESTPGVGSTFTFAVPVRVEQQATLLSRQASA